VALQFRQDDGYRTGDLWIGDVGQGDWEEVDILVAGGNYGWRLKEGDHCYDPPDGCDTIPGLIDPVWEYAHDGSGGCSITGGYVYRGSEIPSLAGKYLFGDYCSGRIWSLDSTGPGQGAGSLVLDTSRNIMSFGVDRDNEVYVCSGGDGKIYKLVAVHPPVPSPRSPGDGAIDIPPDPELRWSPSPSAVRYHLQVAADSGFTIFVVNDTTLTDTGRVFSSGPGPSKYYWRVRARNEVGWSPFSAAWSFTTAQEDGASVGYGEGWNIVALPLATPEGAMDSVFPSAISGAFAYAPGAGYSSRDTLRPGEGYWVKFGDAQLVSFSGDPRTDDTLSVLAGWNLIGGLSSPVDVDSVEASPADIVVSRWFGYDGSYVAASSLDPGRGYWVKVSAAGELVLRSAAGMTPSTRPPVSAR
jgi:hypothetical protein